MGYTVIPTINTTLKMDGVYWKVYPLILSIDPNFHPDIQELSRLLGAILSVTRNMTLFWRLDWSKNRVDIPTNFTGSIGAAGLVLVGDLGKF